MNKKEILAVGSVVALVLMTKTASAQVLVCDLCAVAIIAGTGLSRWLGISDLVSGVWFGALVLAMALWIISWLNKKNIKFLFRKPLIVIGAYVFTIWPLYVAKIVGNPLNKFWGVDKLLFGMIVGTIAFGLGLVSYKVYINKKGKALFPFQKVVMPVGVVVIASLIMYAFAGK